MSHEVQQVELHGTRRCNTSLQHIPEACVPASFSCVCKCYDFVPATNPRYTTLMRVASVCTTHLFVAGTCRCNMFLSHDPSCLPTLMNKRNSIFNFSRLSLHSKATKKLVNYSSVSENITAFVRKPDRK